MRLTLESLSDGIPVLTPAAAVFYKENCMVCLDKHNHVSGVSLVAFQDERNREIELAWEDNVTEQMHRAYADTNKTTDFGACAIALLLVRELTEFTAVRQSSVGTTIDYYLARQDVDDTLIFNDTVRLEVSGILTENDDNTVESRIKQKIRRLKQASHENTLIIVVEFSRPYAKMVEL